MRNWQNPWCVELNNIGRPFVGKLTFYEPGTQILKQIFDKDGTVLANPNYVSGLPEYQICLSDSDYKVTMEEYIGNGNMVSDNNESSWKLIRTMTSFMDGSSSVNPSGTVQTVNTLEDLKEITGMTTGTCVQVLGYNSSTDASPRLFVWNSESTATDDGGIVVSATSTSTGRWLMLIPGDYIDVRWYGDIPDSIANPTVGEQTSNGSQRVKAATAANTYGKVLYFPKNQGQTLAHYIFDGSNVINVSGDIRFDKGVRFTVKDDTTGTRVTCSNVQEHGGTGFSFERQGGGTAKGGYRMIVGDSCVMKTSWAMDSTATQDPTSTSANFNAKKVLINDTSISAFTGAEVIFDITWNYPLIQLQLDGCKVISDHKIESVATIKNCLNFSDSWFSSNYDFSSETLTLEGNQLELCNFECDDNCADNYVKCCNLQNYSEYGSLNGCYLTAIELSKDAVISDCTFVDTIIVGKGTPKIDNCTGTLKIGTSNTRTNPTFTNCSNLSLVQNSGVLPIFSDFKAENCTLSADATGLNCNGNVALVDSTLNNALTCGSARIDAYGCRFNGDITLWPYSGTNLKFKDCSFDNGTITHYTNPDDEWKNFEFVNCRFGTDAYHELKTYTTTDAKGTVVSGAWKDNYGAGNTSPILITRANTVENEQSHSYVYDGNAGSFYPQNFTKKFAIRLVTGMPGQEGDVHYDTTTKELQPLLIDPDTEWSEFVGKFNMFTLGTSGFNMFVNTSFVSNNSAQCATDVTPGGGLALTYRCTTDTAYSSYDMNAADIRLENPTTQPYYWGLKSINGPDYAILDGTYAHGDTGNLFADFKIVK